ncbi:MAG: PDZ domain-containing protein [Planctomycetota bacterium]|nr:PDZ domain-containing protein [Planctomycetota bacterium]
MQVAVAAVALALTPALARAQAYLADDPSAWAEQVAVEYTVSLARAHSQLVDITARLPNPDGRPLSVRLPTWRPGKYLILDHAGTIVQLRARDANGLVLPVHKTDKATWRIDPVHAGDIVIEYTIYANSLNDRTRHADDTHAFLSGSAAFLYTDSSRHLPLRVRVEVPQGWQVATGLAPDPVEPNAWLAPDYDVLVDSPLEIGEHQLIGFSVDGTPHDIVIWGQAEADAEKLAADFAAIVRAHRDIFEGVGGRLPYQRYVFMIHSQPGIGGGTEHLNSTIMHTRPSTFTSDSSYERFLGLVSHEMFHTWNVKRLRPAGMTPYNYQLENYTDLLWVAEGTTSYYDDVTLVRAGLIEPDSYLAQMSRTISRERLRPGYAVQSLADSSYDAWIKFNRSTPNDVNTTVSFYTKGALVSLMLDLEIRSRTDNAVSLDNVLRQLYLRYPLDAGGFTTSDMLDMLESLTETSFEAFFGAYVSGTQPLDLDRAFAVAGLTLVEGERPKGAYLGISMSGETVRTVRANGPAFAAGVQANDTLRTVNGDEFDGDLDELLEEIRPGKTVTLGLTRREQPREIRIVTMARPVATWTLEHVDEPTALQRAVYESWLGQAWPAPEVPAEDPPVPSDP